jgi:hypothetical protein
MDEKYKGLYVESAFSFVFETPGLSELTLVNFTETSRSQDVAPDDIFELYVEA